jgi:hypothetical protein
MALLTSFKLSGGIKIAFALGGALLAVILVFVNFSYVWLGILTLALAAHMMKDAKEFKKIERLEKKVGL